MEIRAVICDLDGTLYDYDAAHASAFRALYRHVRELFGGVTEEAFASDHAAAMEVQRARTGGDRAAVHERLIRYQIMLEARGIPIRHAPDMVRAYWSAFLETMRPFPGAREAVLGLKADGLLIGVGTNMTAWYQYEKLRRLDLLDALDLIVTSEECGAEKPDGRLFHLCAEKAGCAPGACVFVGDDRERDALGARAAGMVPVWLCPDPVPERDGPVRDADGIWRIGSLAEARGLIRSLRG